MAPAAWARTADTELAIEIMEELEQADLDMEPGNNPNRNNRTQARPPRVLDGSSIAPGHRLPKRAPYRLVFAEVHRMYSNSVMASRNG